MKMSLLRTFQHLLQLTSAKIGATSTASPLPQAIGDIPGGGSLSITLRFAAACVGALGTAAVLSYAGTYTGNSFGGSARVTHHKRK
ncbi:hypothetical protein SBA3_2470012 [Candidatus Sulfopaludibacter sp. SbA3]|nr:hypothetical protein SBA3_2470012 [Candidatus Sulfopaludibacter sp. SbA3]